MAKAAGIKTKTKVHHVHLASGDYVKSQTEFTEYYDIGDFAGFFGTLDALSNDISYKIKINNTGQSIVVAGEAISLPRVVDLKRGWNYLPYPHHVDPWCAGVDFLNDIDYRGMAARGLVRAADALTISTAEIAVVAGRGASARGGTARNASSGLSPVSLGAHSLGDAQVVVLSAHLDGPKLGPAGHQRLESIPLGPERAVMPVSEARQKPLLKICVVVPRSAPSYHCESTESHMPQVEQR